MSEASVIICTHDRAAMVVYAVRGALDEARALGAEVLVVDNASRDGTPALLADLASRHPDLRVVREPELGLSAARNRGLAEARADVAVFLDDDAVPRPGWLAAILRPYARRGVACVGGRVLLRFAEPPPSWLGPELHPAFSGYDAGDEARALRYRPGDVFPYGANISFRVAPVRALGGFSQLVGLRGRRQSLHEETDLCYRLDQAGAEIRYAPDAIVDHDIPSERLRPAWLLDRFHHGGRSAATFELRNRGVHGALGRLRWHYGAHLAAAPYTPREPIDGARFLTECRRREALGYVVGLMQGLLRLRALRRDVMRPAA
jgi:GT2 family glycosyltransferase